MVSQTKRFEKTEEDRTRSLSAKTRLISAVGLFFLAPLIGEFLLGNLPITWLWVLPILAPLYGGGALLIREVTRRLSLGWPSLVVLALAYAVIEEAFVTQTLFNPDYLGLRLLDYGYIPSMGISAWWTVFVLGIHTIWSIAVPIALVESFSPQARQTPWLGPVGIAVTVVLFVIGCVLAFQQQGTFMASTAQRLASAAVVVVLIVIAILLGRVKINGPANIQAPPSALRVGGTAFILGSMFMLLAIVHDAIPASLNVAGMIGVFLTGCLLFWRWSRRAGWEERHRFAIAGGFLLTYCWYGFVQIPSASGTDPLLDTVGNAIFASGALALLLIAKKRVE